MVITGSEKVVLSPALVVRTLGTREPMGCWETRKALADTKRQLPAVARPVWSIHSDADSHPTSEVTAKSGHTQMDVSDELIGGRGKRWIVRAVGVNGEHTG